MGGNNAFSIFLLAILVIIVIGPDKLPRSLEQLWLTIENFRRQQSDRQPIVLSEARKLWKKSGSPFYALIGGLYQGAEHLSELRRRLMTTAIAMMIAAFIAIFFATHIFTFLKAPAGDIELIFVRPPEMILTYFKVALLCGVTAGIPFLVYQILLFVYPAMESKKEQRSFKLLAFFAVPSALLFFIGGLAFAYFVLLPFALRYLFSFGSEIARPWWTISEYTSFVLGILFWIGVAFETPLIMLILSRMGVISANQIAKKRRHAIVLIAIAAAAITPTPDPFNMTLVMLPLYGLFELGIILARIAGKKPTKEKQEQAPS